MYKLEMVKLAFDDFIHSAGGSGIPATCQALSTAVSLEWVVRLIENEAVSRKICDLSQGDECHKENEIHVRSSSSSK